MNPDLLDEVITTLKAHLEPRRLREQRPEPKSRREQERLREQLRVGDEVQ